MRGNTLGLPNYDYEKYHSGHIGLIEQMGHNKDSVLRFDKKRWKLITVDGQDVLDAFVADLQNIILPAISNDLAKYQQAIINAHNERMKRMR